MSPLPAVIGTLVGAIPAEEDAALVAQAGERGRITSRGGSVDISSTVLTVTAVDELNAQIFPPAQLQALEETGVAQFDFEMPGIDGTFTALAGSIAGDRWLEIRRRRTATPASVQPAAESTAAPQATGGFDDLPELEGLDLPERNMDSFLDGLTLSEDVLEGPAFGAPNEPANEGRHQIDRPEIAAADSARARTVVDSRPLARRLIRIGLPVAVCLAALVAGIYFGAMRRASAVRTAAARSSAAAPKSPPARASGAPLKAPAPRQETSAAAMPQATSPTQTTTSSAPSAPTVRPEEPSRSGFSVQVAAVRTRDEADRLVRRFGNQGYPAYLVRGEGAAANFYRVRIGTFADREAAEDVARELEGIEGVKPWIAKEIPENKPAASQMLPREEGANRR